MAAPRDLPLPVYSLLPASPGIFLASSCFQNFFLSVNITPVSQKSPTPQAKMLLALKIQENFLPRAFFRC
jgi:hypothetical protein